MKQLNSLNSPDSIVRFILEFEPFLEKTAQNIKLKQESANKLKLESDAMSQQWTIITQSQIQINELKEQAKMDKDQVEIYNANTSSWTKQVEKLQLKIEEERRKKT